MPTAITAPPLTAEDYRSMPDHGPRYQLVEGDLHRAPAPNRFHQDISRNLELIIANWTEENPGGVVYHAPFDVYLDENNVFQPDILYVSPERRSVLTDAGAEGAPDLVVEILSPSTARLDFDLKRKVYARCGVTELWIIQPDSRTLLRYLLQENAAKPLEIYAEEETLETPLLPGLTISLQRVFRQP